MARKKRSEILTKNITNHERSTFARKWKRMNALIEEVKENQTKKGENKK